MSDLFDLTDVEAQFFAEGDNLWRAEADAFTDLEADAKAVHALGTPEARPERASQINSAADRARQLPRYVE